MFSGEVESGRKVQKIAGGRKGTEERHVGHTGHVLCMAISSDGKYLVRDNTESVMVCVCNVCGVIVVLFNSFTWI